jgi:hypothetical protein
MNRNAGALLEQADAYVHLLDRVSVGGRFEGLSSDGPIRLSSDQELLEATESVSRLVRLAEAERVKLAGEIARRSATRDETSLARRTGTGTAANLVSQVTGVPREQAGTMVCSAEAFRPGESISGEPLPAKYAQVAVAFADGLLDPAIAAAMRRALDKAASGLAPFEVDTLEAVVVAKAQEGYAPDLLLAWLKQVPAHAHPNGGAPNADEPAPVASVTRRELPNGLIRWVADLDPLTDGFLKTAIDANTAIKRSLLTTRTSRKRMRRPRTVGRSRSGESTACGSWRRRPSRWTTGRSAEPP